MHIKANGFRQQVRDMSSRHENSRLSIMLGANALAAASLAFKVSPDVPSDYSLGAFAKISMQHTPSWLTVWIASERQLRQICFCMKHAEFADDFYRQKSMKSITNQQGKHHLWASFIIARRGEQAHFWALYSAMPAATKQLKRKEGLFSQLSGRRLNRLWNRPPWGLKIFVCFVGMEFHFCFHFNESTSLVLALKRWKINNV